MDRTQKWVLGRAAISASILLATALFVSESKQSQSMLEKIIHEFKSKM